nr:uncharacterized protein CTRU02_05523 [Colletotrichum truncatum]KAF6793966.1 hypothetical protein CTRU02_05523 [Colletotrichum truncatum]
MAEAASRELALSARRTIVALRGDVEDRQHEPNDVLGLVKVLDNLSQALVSLTGTPDVDQSAFEEPLRQVDNAFQKFQRENLAPQSLLQFDAGGTAVTNTHFYGYIPECLKTTIVYLKDCLSGYEIDVRVEESLGECVGECLQFCTEAIDHIDSLQPREPAQAYLEDLETMDRIMIEYEDQFIQAKTRGASKEELVRIETLWSTARQIRKALNDGRTKKNVSYIENHADADKAVQVLVSTDGNTISGKNNSSGRRAAQVGGHYSTESLQQLVQNMSTWIQEDACSTCAEFEKKHGHGVKLFDNRTS